MSIKWMREDFSKEKDEFSRVAADFSGNDRKALTENTRQLESLYRQGKLITLSASMWRRLDNTDSWNTKTIKDIERAIRRNSKGSGTRSIEKIIREYISGKVRAPIVLEFNGGKSYTLIAGNTRLMAARMLEIEPKVLLVKSDW